MSDFCLVCAVCAVDASRIGGVCGKCKQVAYCSNSCKNVHWEKGHALVCHKSAWTQVEGGGGGVPTEVIEVRFDVSRDPDAQFGNKERMRFQGDGGGVDLLNAIIDRLQNVTTEAGWRLAQDFFSSMRIVLIDLRSNAHRLLNKTRLQLTEAADRWARLAALDRRGGLGILNMSGGGGGGGEGQDDLTSLQKWQVARARDDKNETGADRIILYLLDREASLEEVIKAANMLLGPPFVLEEHEVAAAVAMNTPRRQRLAGGGGGGGGGGVNRGAQAHPKLVRYARDEPILGLGFDTLAWNPEDPGVYLLFDWDIETAQPREENVIEAGNLPPAFYGNRDAGSTEERVALARIKWLGDFRSELLEIAKLIGLDAIKGKIATFIQTLIVNPISSRRGFMNIAILGEPGTGKTEIATRLPQIFYRLGYAPRRYAGLAEGGGGGEAAITTKADWVAPYEGQSSHQARMTMLRGLGRMIVLDEAYSLVIDDMDGFGKESLTQIVNDLDELRGIALFVILGYEQGMRALFEANKGLARRVPNVWTIAPYSPSELVRILLLTAQKMDFVVPANLPLSRDVRDLVSALHAEGLFTSVNAGAAAAILNLYRGIYSQQRFAAGQGRVESPVLNEAMLLTAISMYARDNGVYVWEGDDDNEGVAGTPMLSRNEGPVRIPPQPSVTSSREPTLPPLKGILKNVKLPPTPPLSALEETDSKERDMPPPPPESLPPRPKFGAPPDPPKVSGRRPKKRQ